MIYNRLVEGLSREGRIETKPVLRKHEKGILVEIVTYQIGVLAVSFSSMDKKKRLEESKLANYEVGTSCGLLAFKT